MPYIIETTMPDRTTRVAVETLYQARESVRAFTSPGQRIQNDELWRQCLFGADGGTIGPLPDGTVIRVESVTRRKLWEALDANAQDHLRAGRLTAVDVAVDEILAAFNDKN
jgi:hypothetical protein